MHRNLQHIHLLVDIETWRKQKLSCEMALATDDNMSDDVFMGSDEEIADLEAPKKITPHPSPTGYRDYKPPVHLLKQPPECEVLHKVRFISNRIKPSRCRWKHDFSTVIIICTYVRRDVRVRVRVSELPIRSNVTSKIKNNIQKVTAHSFCPNYSIYSNSSGA